MHATHHGAQHMPQHNIHITKTDRLPFTSCITWLSCACHLGATWQPYRGPPRPVVYATQLLPVSRARASCSETHPLRPPAPRSPAARQVVFAKPALEHCH